MILVPCHRMPDDVKQEIAGTGIAQREATELTDDLIRDTVRPRAPATDLAFFGVTWVTINRIEDL